MRLVLIMFLLLAAPAAAAELPYVHAHRGGPQRLSEPAFAEETMPAFRDAWEVQGAVLELDVKLSSDGVPVVIHDDTLDRTTPCSGPVSGMTWAQLGADCPSDVIGIDPYKTAPAKPPVPMVRLRTVLDYALESGAPINLEIKNIPGENDFDASPAYATTVLEEIKASGLPLSQLIVQSFYPPNLDVAEQMLPGVQTSFLTNLPGVTESAPQYAATQGYEWWSPVWPVPEDRIAAAQALGLKVLPWTVDTPAAVKAVKAAGADAVITNDPTMARRALGIPARSTPGALRGCGKVRGARRIRANRAAGSCAKVRRVVRTYLRRGCRPAWSCQGKRRVTLRSNGRVVRFRRPRAG